MKRSSSSVEKVALFSRGALSLLCALSGEIWAQAIGKHQSHFFTQPRRIGGKGPGYGGSLHCRGG